MVRKIRKKLVDGEGDVYEGDAITLDLSSKGFDELMEDLIQAVEDDKIIKNKALEIHGYYQETEGKPRLERYYKLGQMLQFIDDLQQDEDEKRAGSIYMTNDKRQALKRLYADLNANPTTRAGAKRVHRYGERAYMLAKLPKELVFKEGMTWSHWFDILEYPRIFENRKELVKLIDECSKKKWASGKSGQLRGGLQKLNEKIARGGQYI